MKSGLVSIVIAVHNQPEYTKLCLDSLAEFTAGNLYELLVVDNASGKRTRQLLERYEANIIRQQENMGVTPAWNCALKQAKGDFIAFIHNDVLMTPGWLDNLFKPLADPEIWCVSPRLSRQKLPGDFAHISKLINAQPSKYFKSYLERSCFILARKALDALGVFDECLKTYYYDFDYQYRLTKAGHAPVQANNAAIHHFESRTVLSIPNLMQAIKPSEWEYLHKKWNMVSSGSPVEGPEFEEQLARLEAVRIPKSLPNYKDKVHDEIVGKIEGKGKIVACINVFNEVQLLPGCIESLSGVDEIHIVDGAYQDFPHEKPWSIDGTIKWIEGQMREDNRIKLTTCRRPWKDEVEKRNAFFTADEGDWYLMIDADEQLVGQNENTDAVQELKVFLDGCKLDAFSVRIREPFAQAGAYQYARLFRHLPGIRIEACHYNIVADNDRYMWLAVQEGGNLLLYSGFYLLHQKCFRPSGRIREAESYYQKKNASEVRNLRALILENYGDKSKKKALRCWVKMYEHLMSQVPPEAKEKLDLDRRYLEAGE